MTEGTKWQPGTAYGPVLQPTELYLLNPKVELHPILTNSMPSFHLNFHLVTGRATGLNVDSDRDLEFTAKGETATLPRVTELIIIAQESPWCTVVKNPLGVTLADICGQVWKDYSEHLLTEEEFAALPPATQGRVKRHAAEREMQSSRFMGWGGVEVQASRCKRIDWLRDRVFFDGLKRDDDFAKARLGYASPNIFRMSLIP